MVRRGGDAARMQALLAVDATDCWHLLRWGRLAFWVLCRLHYGPRITVPRSLRWASCGAISTSSTSSLLVRLFSPECELQNIAAFDKQEHKTEWRNL
ncbi:hypothetical protein GQ55_5G437500 [Panicum hallii var. hallii]|uniref:DUF7875 domain-containing protein n=1 Tax=Panicum hallii var. hallii TaxID=1504633 RepID=A0A2T7DPJ9_9POAL|nr:hypothetical protein GQ55_5G437500 [Panicum hallii var. hallii]